MSDRESPLERGPLEVPIASTLLRGRRGSRRKTDEPITELATVRVDIAERLTALLDSFGCQVNEQGWRTLAVALAMAHHPAFTVKGEPLGHETPKAAEKFHRDVLFELFRLSPDKTEGSGRPRSIREKASLVQTQLRKEMGASPGGPPTTESLKTGYQNRRRDKIPPGLAGKFPNAVVRDLHAIMAMNLVLEVAEGLSGTLDPEHGR